MGGMKAYQRTEGNDDGCIGLCGLGIGFDRIFRPGRVGSDNHGSERLMMMGTFRDKKKLASLPIITTTSRSRNRAERSLDAMMAQRWSDRIVAAVPIESYWSKLDK